MEGVAREAASRAASAAAVLLLLYGTFLTWVVLHEPAADTPLSLLASAAVLSVWWPGRHRLEPARALAVGALSGAAFALRAPSALLLLLPLSSIAWAWPDLRARGALARTALLGAGFAGAAVLMTLSWPVPFSPLHRPLWTLTLFSSRQGLLFWNPVLWAGVLGYAALWRRERRCAGMLLAALLGMVLFHAATREGWSGPFAARRFDSALPLFGLGLAAALHALRRSAARAPGRVLAAAGGALVLWNLLLMQQYREGALPRDATVSFVAVAETSAGLLARAVGAPPAWPANWAFAARHHLNPARFDLLVGKRLPASGRIDVGDPVLDAALLAEGWSVRHHCGDAVCREVEGRARLLVPLEGAEPRAVAVSAAGRGELNLAVDGAAAGRAPLAPTLSVLRFPLRPGAGRQGIREIVLFVSPDGQALVDGLHFERAAP